MTRARSTPREGGGVPAEVQNLKSLSATTARHHPRKRVIPYPEISNVKSSGRGVLDTPLAAFAKLRRPTDQAAAKP